MPISTTPAPGYTGARAYRAAPLSIASTLTHLAFDTPSPLATPQGVSISGGDLVSEAAGWMLLSVNAVVPGVAGLAGLRMRITREPGGAADNAFDVTFVQQPGEDHVAHADVLLDVAAGQLVRVELAVVGVAAADLDIADAATHANAVVFAGGS
jgi:hypothetical protein